MKRDIESIREILLEIEADDSYDTIDKLSIDGYSNREILYHVILMEEAGLIYAEINNDGLMDLPPFFIGRLTWAGHDFLDSCRDDGIWNDAKAIIGGKISSVSFDVLKTVLVTLSKETVLSGLG